jgi:hypothetical protein
VVGNVARCFSVAKQDGCFSSGVEGNCFTCGNFMSVKKKKILKLQDSVYFDCLTDSM